jgi:pyrroline-5-carboxylate reductase
MKTVAFIGAGNMAEAIIRGVLHAGLFKPDALIASDVAPARRLLMAEKYGIRTTSENLQASEEADCVVLGVKPMAVDSVLSEIRPLRDKVLISVAAGIPIARLRSGDERGVIRVMPNAPASVHAGATVLTAAAGGDPSVLTFAVRIFESIGRVWVLSEGDLDAVTGLSGSGPAYVFMMIEALADGGVKSGLSREVALALAAQTVFGAAKMLIETGEHPARLKDFVASPGGTTMAGLHQMEVGGVRAALISAVEAATARSKVLGAK